VPPADSAFESGVAFAADGVTRPPPADAAPLLDSPDTFDAAELDASAALDAAADSLEAELPDGEHPTSKTPIAAVAPTAAMRVLRMCGFLDYPCHSSRMRADAGPHDQVSNAPF
jgi:hypothetical protein